MKGLSALVLAAGKGERFSRRISKPLAKINRQPILIYSLRALNAYPAVSEIIAVVNRKNRKDILRQIIKYGLKKVRAVVLGGSRRQDSVACGLKAVSPGMELVLIHDAVRPFLNSNTLSRVIRQAEISGAAIVGVPVKATIKQSTEYRAQSTEKVLVKKTIDRKNLWEIQTPQVFRKELLLAAYKKYRRHPVTDDAMLVEKMGVKVALVRGSYHNIKITTPEDLVIAEAIAKNSNKKK